VADVEAHPHLGPAPRRGQELGAVGLGVDHGQPDAQAVARRRQLLKPAAPVAHGHRHDLQPDIEMYGDRAALTAVGVLDRVVARLADRRPQIVHELGAQCEWRGQATQGGADQARAVGPAVQAQVEDRGASRSHVWVLPGCRREKTGA
jgi:hypothetical protein